MGNILRPLTAILALTFFSAAGIAQNDMAKTITIGTGGSTGVYYPLGTAVCNLVNRDYTQHGIRCLVDETSGSIANLNALRSGELDIGLAQSDQEYNAYQGLGPFAEQGPDKNLRNLFSTHSESFTVLARTDSNIKTLDDLKGKRVNIGNPGSGQRATMEALMKAKDWTFDDFSEVSELEPDKQSQALCNNQVDAIIYTVGHPNRSILEATIVCDARIVQVTDSIVNKLVQDNAYYTHETIPGGIYRGNYEDVKTFGVRAMVVSSTQTSQETVYQVVKSVFENLDEFNRTHHVLGNQSRENMIIDNSKVPLHEGAKSYFKEAGLLDLDISD
jgi:TRAP transporter TAXI family solute receptor